MSLTTDDILELANECGNNTINSDNAPDQNRSNSSSYRQAQLTPNISSSSPIIIDRNIPSFVEDTSFRSNDNDDHIHNKYENSDNKETSVDNRTKIVNETYSSSNKQINKKREVYRFNTNFLVSSVAWSNESSESFKLAIASYKDQYKNTVELVNLYKDDYNEELTPITSFEHPYPPTKILWFPKTSNNNAQYPQLIATTADYLRLWRVVQRKDKNYNFNQNDSFEYTTRNLSSTTVSGGSLIDESDDITVKLEVLLNQNKGMNHCSPLTSFDWNDIDPSIIVTSSVDTTCAVWDLEVGTLLHNLSIFDSPSSSSSTTTTNSSSNDINLRSSPISRVVAHNDQVFDVSFSKSGSGRDIFITAGGDGSIRLFDLRRLSTSTVLYEFDKNIPDNQKAFVRVACNKQDSNIISAFATNSKEILMLDLRKPNRTLAILGNHLDDINSMSWAPHSAHHLCSASDDKQALIWELSKMPEPIDEPLLAYRANGKINSISWSAAHPDWISIGFQNYLELLRV